MAKMMFQIIYFKRIKTVHIKEKSILMPKRSLERKHKVVIINNVIL